MHYENRVFFRLNDRSLMPIKYEDYVSLMHRRQPMPEYAGQQIRLAIFYLEMTETVPATVINAAYELLELDEDGFPAKLPRKYSRRNNREFFATLADSDYDNIDCDPEIRQLREKLGGDFSWVPTMDELIRMRHIMSAE